MSSNYIISVILLSICFSLSHAQSEGIDDVISDIAYEMTAEQMDGLNFEQHLQTLYYFNERPIHINEASKEDLKQLKILSDFQIFSLMEHRKKYGYFYSIYELPSVIGFNVDLAKKLQPFIRFDISPEKIKQNREVNGIFLARTGKKYSGFQSLDDFNNLTDYKLYSKLNLNIFDKVGINITAENDPGEMIFNDTLPKGPDFTSASIALKNVGIVHKIVLGDYNVNLNQGLMIWTGYGGYKGSNHLNVSKSGRKVTKYTSSNEMNYMRGMAVHLQKKNFNSLLFYSNKNVDANLLPIDSTDNNQYFSSLSNTGSHRTETELSRRKKVNEQILGGNLGFQHKNFSLNIGASLLQFNYPFNRNQKLYLINETNGTNYFSLSLGYNYQMPHVLLFGEEVYQPTTGKFASLNGINIMISEELNTVILYRDYPSGYYNQYAKGFGEYSGTSNEKGIYMGAAFHPTSEWEFTGFADLFQTPWLRYNVTSPANGHEYGCKIGFSNYDYSIYGQYKYSGKYKNIPLDAESNLQTRQIVYKIQQSLRFHMKFKIKENLYNQTRLEMKNYFGASDYPGYMFYNSVNYSPPNKSSFSLRYTYYNSKDFDSRIYAYERDVLYSMSIPAFYGRGYKITFNTKIQLTQKLKFWIKYGFQKEYETVINYKEKYNKHELKFQLGYRI